MKFHLLLVLAVVFCTVQLANAGPYYYYGLYNPCQWVCTSITSMWWERAKCGCTSSAMPSLTPSQQQSPTQTQSQPQIPSTGPAVMPSQQQQQSPSLTPSQPQFLG